MRRKSPDIQSRFKALFFNLNHKTYEGINDEESDIFCCCGYHSRFRNIPSKRIFSSSTTSRDKVDAIIEKYVEARGGHELLEAIKSAKLTGKTVDGGKEYTTTVFYQRPNLLRINDELASESIVTAFDGREAWWSFDGDPPVPVPGDEMFIYETDFEGPLVNYQKKGHQVKFLGIDTVDGREVSKLALTLKRGQTWTIYIDNTSYLEVKRVWDNGPAGFEFLPGDYRRANGVLIPFSMKNKLGNEIVSERVFEAIETNVDIDRALFNRSSIQPKNRAANPQAALTELTDLAQLRDLFNRDEGLVRVVTLLSPSCPGCRRGYQDMIQILKNIPDDRLRFYNVFFNVLSSDNHTHAEDRAR